MATIPILDRLIKAQTLVDNTAMQLQAVYLAMSEKLASVDVDAPDAKEQIAAIRAAGNEEATAATKIFDDANAAANVIIGEINADSSISQADKQTAAEISSDISSSRSDVVGARDGARAIAAEKIAKIPVTAPDPNATTVAVSDAEAKTAEAGAAVNGTFGTDTPFSKLGASLPTTEQMQAELVLKGSGIAGTTNFAMPDIATEASPTAAQIKDRVYVQGKLSTAHKVRLVEAGGGDAVIFDVLPEISENHTSDYEALPTVQAPGAFQKYKGNSTTTWTMQITFISRTSREATANLDRLNRLRGWMKPVFGTRSQSIGDKLGAPPKVLMLSGLRNLIGPVPVVITSMNFSWPKDVDYIATTKKSELDGNFIPFPVVINFPLTLSESYSIQQFNNFSLDDYAHGRMDAAFNLSTKQAAAALATAEAEAAEDAAAGQAAARGET